MKIFSLLVFSFALQMLSSCNEVHEESGISLEVVGNNNYELDTVTKVDSKCVEFFGESLFFLNTFNGKIYKYSDNGKNVSTIPTYKEGPNSIGSINGFKVLTDSTFLITAYRFMGFAIINLKGEIMHKQRFRIGKSQAMTTPSNSTLYRNQVISEVKGLYIGNSLPGNWNNYDQTAINRTSIEKWFDSAEDSLFSMSITYPNDYLINGHQSFYHSRLKIENKLIYSFSYSHNVYVYEVSENEVINKNVYDLGLSELEAFEGEKTPNDVSEVLINILKKAEYRSLYYDFKNKLYYRVGYIEENEQQIQDANLFLLSKNRSKPFIIVFDEFFNKLGEVLLPEKVYNLDIIYVNEGRIHIAKSHHWNKNLSEDLLQFEQLKVIINE